MKILFYPICALLLTAMVLSGGCASPRRKNVTTSKAAGSTFRHTEEEEFAKKTGEKILNAFREGNAEAFLNCIPEESRKDFGKQGFESARQGLQKEFGEIEYFSYALKLNQPVLKTYIWKVGFVRKGTADKTQTVRQEILFRIVLGSLDGKPYLTHFGFH